MGAALRVSKKPATVKKRVSQKVSRKTFLFGEGGPLAVDEVKKKSCYARLFDLLRNSPLSSIHIHFGVELLVLPALVTSASLPKNEFF